MTSLPAHVSRVKTLYRRSLKTLLDWATYREVFYFQVGWTAGVSSCILHLFRSVLYIICFLCVDLFYCRYPPCERLLRAIATS